MRMRREAQPSTTSLFILLSLLLIGPTHGAFGTESGGATLCAFVQQSVVVAETASQRSSPVQPSTPFVPAAPAEGGTALPELLADNRTVRCAKASDKCYALWSKDPHNSSSFLIIAQGCWESSGKCSQSECVVEGTPSKARNNTKFCCCAGNMCNVNIRDELPALLNHTLQQDEALGEGGASVGAEPGLSRVTTVITLVSGAAIMFLVVVVLSWLLRRRMQGKGLGAEGVGLMEAGGAPPPSPTLDLDKLKLIELLDSGCYGCVWRGTLGEREVAAKVFSHQHRAYYLNEKDIYGLAFMDHPAITRFIGADERVDPASGKPYEYLLVMAHAPHGCLQDYLRRHTVDWPTLCRMTSSVAKGLAHMHTDIRKGSKVKPCISHRDINSRNVLVKSDMSCALCDMGFAMKIAGSKYYGQNGEEQHAETTSLTDVGTLRYMAPEVLEGAVNLRDCESSLKQIDVYAMGLVLWEVASRCGDLYQGTEVHDYKLPFQNEIGLHPTFEQMQVLVSRNKARPLFPEVWKDSNLAIRLLKETIEDCWDQDAEARLTSLCVEERLHELPNLWERHKANLGVSGVSPTVNPTTIYNHNQQSTATGHLLSIPGGGTVNHVGSLSDSEVTDRNANIVSLNDVLPRSANHNANRMSNLPSSKNNTNDSSVSEQTEETLLTLSPSSDFSMDGASTFHDQPSPSPPPPPPPPPPPLPVLSLPAKNSANNHNNRHNPHPHNHPPPLQPHQGRNPCLERNMIMEPLEEVTVSGNRLLDKRHNCKTPPRNVNRNRDLSPEQMGNLYDALSIVDSAENNALVSSDVLGHTTNRSSTVYHHPIPYLQNAVHSSFPVCPKQPNVPGNGHSHCQALPNAKQPKRGLRKHWPSSSHGQSSGGGGHHHRKVKDWSSFRSLLLDWTKLNSTSNNEEVNRQRTRMDILNSEKSNLLGHSNVHSNPQTLQNTKVQTRVSLSNGQQSQGLTTVTLVNHANADEYEDAEDDEHASPPEVGVARLHVPNGSTPVHVVQARSRLANGPIAPPPPPPQRPNSLPVKGHRVSSIDNLAKVEQRVKTPFKLKTNRLSLCDDRMMTTGSVTSGAYAAANSNTTTGVPCKYSISVPHDISLLNRADGDASDSRQLLVPPLLPLPTTSGSSASAQQLVNKQQVNGSVYQVSCI